MSCGNPHDIDCSEVLDDVYEYLHDEMAPDRIEEIRRHLDECSPCLEQYGLEEAVREVLLRSCSCEHAPESLLVSVRARITQIRVEGAR